MSLKYVLALTGVMSGVVSAHAQTGPAIVDLQSSNSAGPGYWTSARMRAAKPMVPPTNNQATAPNGKPVPQSAQVPSYVPGGAPTQDQKSLSAQPRMAPPLPLAAQKAQQDAAKAEGEAGPTADKYGLPFTTSRVTPDDTRMYYPASAVGKLFFTEQGVGDYVCSGEVLRPRVVQVAGHCVANPSTTPADQHFYTNFVFVPGYANGNAPYGQWVPSYAGTTWAWLASNGSVPNAQDIGELLIVDQGGSKIGDYTGYLGYATGVFSSAQHLTVLGYPCNLDSCELMERTDAGNIVYGGNNTAELGSAMGGGASGGPWVLDYGVNPANSDAANVWNLGNNYLVASTSYGPTGTQGYLGASMLDADFLALLAAMCGLQTGSCP